MTDRTDIDRACQRYSDYDRQQAKRAERRRIATWFTVSVMGSAILGTILHIIARVAHP